MKWTESEIVQLVHAHQSALAAYLRSLGCAAGLLEDVLQEVFLALLERRRKTREPVVVRAWLRAVARNTYLASLRREEREARAAEVAAVDAAWVRFEGDDLGGRYLERLRRCLATLADSSREVLRLRYEERSSREQIGAALGLSLGGVKSALLRAKERLRECIERRMRS